MKKQLEFRVEDKVRVVSSKFKGAIGKVTETYVEHSVKYYWIEFEDEKLNRDKGYHWFDKAELEFITRNKFEEQNNTLIELTGINPNLFIINILMYSILFIFLIWGNGKIIFSIVSMLIVLFASYHISTFKVKIREEDQEE